MKNEGYAVKPPNPFNPGSPVDSNDFVGRVYELENFRQKLRQTAGGSLASMAVAGGYGVGKTSFLHKCKSIAEANNALTIYFSLNEIDKLNREALAGIMIDRIRDKVTEEVILERLSKKVLDVLSKIKIKFTPHIEVTFGGYSADQAYPNLQSALAASWRAFEGSRSAIVLLIDEAGVLEKNRAELILYLRAVLEQLQVDKIPVMVIPAGKFSITGPTGTGFSPLVRTFPPVILENFSREESRVFIEKKLGSVELKISQAAFERAYNVTEGHPFVLTAYMSLAYSKLLSGENELTIAHFEAANIEFVPHILAPFFSRFYDDANLWSKKILEKVAEQKNGEISLSELSTLLERNSNQLSPYLAKLVQDGAIIRKDRGNYRLFHQLLGVYIKYKNGKI